MSTIVVMVSFIISCILQVVALPEMLNLIRPNWILMMVIFWSFNSNIRFHVHYAWLIGLFVDVLLGSLLGQHAFVFALSAFIMQKLYFFLKARNIFQQTLYIMLCFLFETLFTIWINGMMNYPSPYTYTSGLVFYSAILSALLWPLFFTLMGHICMILGIVEK